LTQFSNLGLAAPIARAVSARGYITPTPIQTQAIPLVLAGHDLIGIAATGTGKTAAFALPILSRLLASNEKTRPGACRALVLSPTRELAAQIADSCTRYGASTGLTTVAVYGGVSLDKQRQALRRGADIVVACPGRLLDHLERGSVKLDQVSVFVLDEADHMLDLGFIPAVRRIARALPRERQTMLFSATMPPAVRSLADDFLKAPKTVSVTPSATTPALIDQRVIFVDATAKRRRLAELLRERPFTRTLIFTRTKRGADRVVKDLAGAHITAEAIHGNKSQGQRERVLDSFRAGTTAVLVATDIAARGIDVTGIDLVVNFELPHVPETYVHRIGRTARAGAAGQAVSLCAPDERPLLKGIERVLGRAIPGSRDDKPPAPHPHDHAPVSARPSTHRSAPNGHRPHAATSRNGKHKQRRPNAPAVPATAGGSIGEVKFMAEPSVRALHGQTYLRRPRG
jgi:ATP-dependent RNA helicase RhlE